MAKKTDIGSAMKAQLARPNKFARAEEAMADVAEIRPNVHQPGAADRPASPAEPAGVPRRVPRPPSAEDRRSAGAGTVQKNFSIPPADIDLVQQIRSRAASEEAGCHLVSQSEALRIALRAALLLPASELGQLAAGLERLKPGPKAGTTRSTR